MSKIFKEELIHDEYVIKSISYITLARYEGLVDELKEIDENGYALRGSKIVEGSALNKLIEKINIEKELLEYLLKEAEKYRIS
jgi:hypothetical protein